MIDSDDGHLSIARQSQLLGANRSHHYYKKRAKHQEDIQEMMKLKELYLKYPFYGYRKQVLELKKESIVSTAKRVRRLMHEMGLKALSPKKLTIYPE